MNGQEPKFDAGDRVKLVLRNGKIEEGVLRVIIHTTSGIVLNVSFGPKDDLAASVNFREVAGKLPPVN
jgi:hypothetical protein